MPRARPETVAKPGFAEPVRESLGDFQPRGRGIARADDRHCGHCEHGAIAAHREKRRRVVDHLQTARIAGFADGDELCAQSVRGLDLALGLLARIDLRRAATAAAARQRRQRFQRCARAAEMIDQRPKGARTDILAADKAQPVDALFVREMDAFPSFGHFAPNAPSRHVPRLPASIPLKRRLSG